MAARRPSSWRSWLSSALASLWRDMPSMRASSRSSAPRSERQVVGEAVLLDEAQFDIPEAILHRGDHPVQRLDGLFFVAMQSVLDFGETFVQTFVGSRRDARGAGRGALLPGVELHAAPPGQWAGFREERDRRLSSASSRAKKLRGAGRSRGGSSSQSNSSDGATLARSRTGRAAARGPDGGRARRRGRAGESLLSASRLRRANCAATSLDRAARRRRLPGR